MTDLQSLHGEASNELSTLHRVSHRLAMTDAGSQLEKVLHLLLPRLLRRIGSNHVKTSALCASGNTTTAAASSSSSSITRNQVKSLYDGIHAKLIEMMSHILKRVRADPQTQLPCHAILELLYDSHQQTAVRPSTIDPFTLNLSLTFLTIGVSRCPGAELEKMLPGLLAVLGVHMNGNNGNGNSNGNDGGVQMLKSVSKKNQSFQVAHLVLRAVEGIVVSDRRAKVGEKRNHNHAKRPKSASSSKESKSKPIEQGVETEKVSQPQPQLQPQPLDVVRNMCSHEQNDAISAAIYDLLLDVLLYQNTNTNTHNNTLPPPGLSQYGKERLASGPSPTEKNWFIEHASGSRLKELKLALLDFIAPCRRYDLFHVQKRKRMKDGDDNHGHGHADGNNNDTNDTHDHGAEYPYSAVSMARAVALLVVASGDQNLDVADRASSYLKAHLDSRRNTTRKSGGNGSTRSGGGENANGSDTTNHAEKLDPVLELLGDPIALMCELLSITLGDIIAGNAIRKLPICDNDVNLDLDLDSHLHFNTYLGLRVESIAEEDAVVVMTTKRRMISEQNATAIMTFLTARVIDDLPSVFAPAPASASESLSQGTNVEGYFEKCAKRAIVGGTLVVLSTSKYAGSARTMSGVSLTSSAGNPSVASVKLLNSYCIRLVALFDAMAMTMTTSSSSSSSTSTSVEANEYDRGINGAHKEALTGMIQDILSRAFSNACAIISVAASAHSGDVRGSIGIEARDAAYGIICTICRSNMVSDGSGTVFHCGERNVDVGVGASVGSTLSTRTAKALFGCVTNEVETLKPRAVAALDSLLSAYCRLLDKARTATSREQVKVETNPSNPWAMNVDDGAKKDGALELQFSGLTKSLLPLLWNSLQPTLPKASRHAAAQWSNSLLKALDLNSACHILCFIAGDKDVTSASLAISGLGLDGQVGEEIATSNSDGRDVVVPDFSEFVDTVMSVKGREQSVSWRPTFVDFSPKGQAAALRFGLVCLLSDLYGGDDGATITYLDRLSDVLLSYHETGSVSQSKKSPGKIDLLDEASICYAGLLKASQCSRSSIGNERHSLISSQLAELALTVPSSKARRYLATAYLHLLEDTSIWSAPGQFEIGRWIQKSSIGDIVQSCGKCLQEMTSAAFVTARVHGAAYVGASSVRALMLMAREESFMPALKESLQNACSILSYLGRGLLHSDEVIGNACAGAIFIAFSYDAEDAPTLCETLQESASTVLKFANIALKRFGNGDHVDPQRAASLAKATGILLAATTVYRKSSTSDVQNEADAIGKRRLDCVDALFALLGSTANRKDPELALVVGEALANYSDAYSPEGCKWTYPDKGRPPVFDESYANDLPPHAQVLYIVLERELLATSPHKKTAMSPVLLAFVGRAARKIHKNSINARGREFIKAIGKKLHEIQKAFLLLLADPKSKQVGRESCQLGLAACYGFSTVFGVDEAGSNVDSGALNESLLRAFGQTSNHGGSALMENRAQQQERIGAASASIMERFGGETEVGGAAGMSEAALGAFREMASASVVLGRPDVLYSLMLLSVSLPTWRSTEYNASSLLGDAVDASGNIDEIRHALRPHIEKLIPRLLRACNDPNKQTREQMSALWIGLTGGGAEARSLINQHLLSTIDALIDDATNKLWRARVGSCSALAEVIVGRSWEELGGGSGISVDDISKESNCAASRILRLFRITIRSLDDVRLTVRESGEMLSRSVRSLTTRLCDPTVDAANVGPYSAITQSAACEKIQSSAAASATILPWLVKIGLNQACAEASGFSVSCLLNIVQVARPETLQPVLPELIGSLLMSMSGLEPAALNYLQERVASRSSNSSTGINGYDRLERMRLQLAQSGPVAGALEKCIEMLKNVDLDCQKSVIPELDSALRCGAGFATRAAAADAVSSLCSVSPGVFKSFSGNSTSNPTVRLLRALYYASERERGAGAKDKMSHALGNLASLAPGSSVRSLAARLCDRYNNASGGTNDDPAARRAVASALRAIAVRASGQFADGGTNDIWVRRVLPLAFIARKDRDVGSLFNEVWDEGGQAARLRNDSTMFSAHLQETILPFLTTAMIEALGDVSWSRRRIACTSLIELADTNILSPAPRTSEEIVELSDDILKRARIRAQSTCQILSACINLIVTTRIWAGKEDLVKTVAQIAGNWVYHGTGTSDAAYVFGFQQREDIEICPWIPIIFSGTRDDLFNHDRWFLSTNPSKVEEQVDLNPSKLSGFTSDEESKIDFDEGDAILSMDDAENRKEIEGNSTISKQAQSISLYGLIRLLLDQGIPKNTELLTSPEHLQYRAAALESISSILDSIEEKQFASYLQFIYKLVVSRLWPILRHQEANSKPILPLLVAKSFKCFSSNLFYDVGSVFHDDIPKLSEITKVLLSNCGTMQPAWTVREGAGLAAAKLASKGKCAAIMEISIIEDFIECTKACLKDRKFWRVRVAGLKIILSLCARTNVHSASINNIGLGSFIAAKGSGGEDRQMLLEAILPYKETLLGISRSCMGDNEAKVTAAASEIMSALSWWP